MGKYKFMGLLVFGIAAHALWGQNNQSSFDEFMYRRGNVYRSASGYPGPQYFQNKTDYKIKAALSEEANTLDGSVEILYVNNSPQDLDYIWLYVEQNRMTKNSRGNLTSPVGRYAGDLDKGMTIKGLQAETRGSTSSKYLINDTRMQVFLSKPIAAKGGKATIKIDFSFKIPTKGMDRMSRLETKNGPVFAVAQWFPQVAVYDDVKGWNTEPYLGAGEFYYDFGNYEVEITAPYNHLVVSSGKLMNPRQTLSQLVYKRYEQAQKSDKTLYLIKPEEINTPAVQRKPSGTITWKFKIDNAREFAFASSKAFIWDGAKINLPGGKTAFASSVYPIESDGQDAWSRSTEYVKGAIEGYSKKWFEYPYPTAVNVACDIHGMEYPALSFCHYKSKSASLWGVTNHEFGHDWFPMIVGSNERKYPWMDEGLNTFINHYNSLEFNNNEYPGRLDDVSVFQKWLTSPQRESISTYPDFVAGGNLGMTAYSKPALGFFMLREYILGPERFDYALRSYIKAWAYKYPQPSDFFNHIENAVGEDLNWFWKGWFYGNGNIDLSIDEVTKDPRGGYLVALSNKGDIPMPVKMKAVFENGGSEIIELPVEIWYKGNKWTYPYNTDKAVRSFEIDPDKRLPDIDLTNNHKEVSSEN